MGAAGEEEQMHEPGGRNEKIFVSVRLRPLNEKEITRNEVADWECIDDTTIIYRNNLSISERSMYPTAYSFDRVFGCKCSTRKVYEEGAKRVALSVVSGINSSVFAYGQTSSGKTYTMSGITEYTVADIYDYIERHKEREFVLKFSAMEIYNESVRDLLTEDSTPLRLLDDPERGTVVERLREETVRDWNHFKELLSVCEAQRQIGETALNETSSRSHQILRLTIDSSAREFLGCDKSSTLTATVNFVDLAGSERASQSLSAGTRLKEGCHINRSLLTLGTVIRKLSKGRSGHVPYRDSKLTRILQSSLGGNARTAIICTMSPARIHVEQSRNTLLFASCAKDVSTNAQVNVVMSDKALVKHLQRELARLESELRGSGLTSIKSDAAPLLKEKDLEIEKLKKEITELTLQRDLARSQLEDLLRVVEDDRPTKVNVEVEAGYNYPQLRVRTSSDFEEPMSGITAVEGSHSVDFDASQYSDGHSVSSYDDDMEERDAHILDPEEIFPSNISTPRISISSVESNMQQDRAERHIDLKQVKLYIGDESEDSSPPRNFTFNISGMSSNIMSPERNQGTSSMDVVENGDKVDQELVSPKRVEDEESNSMHHRSVFTSSENSFTSFVEKEISNARDVNVTREESFNATYEASLSSPKYEKMEKNESTPPCEFQNGFTGRPGAFQGKAAMLNFDVDVEHETLLRNDPQRLSRIATGTIPDLQDAGSSYFDIDVVAANDIDVEDVKNSSSGKGTAISTIASDGEQMADLRHEKLMEMADYQNEKHPNDETGQKTDLMPPVVEKSVRDIGLDPIQDLPESPENWHLQFDRLRREIIELWHACNVSLIHRSHFFLIFKGEPEDSIYIEVELKRLSFIKEKSSRSYESLVDNSSVKALRQERQMLSRKLKRLSHRERESLYHKWGIGLNTKHRRLQLAHKLWSDTKDMQHIAASAALVAKLVGSVDPDNALKEMFGFSFAPQRKGNKKLYNSIKRTITMKPLLSSRLQSKDSLL